MTSHLQRLAAVLCAAILFSCITLLAQDTGTRPTSSARTNASAGVPEYGPAQVSEPQFEHEYRYYRPVIRIRSDYTLAAGDEVYEVRTALSDVTLSGHVRNDVTVVLGKLHLASTAVVDGSIAAIGGEVVVDPGASVHRDLVVVGGSFTAPAGFAPGGDHVLVGGTDVGRGLRAIMPWLEHGLLWGRPIVPNLGWVWIVFGVIFLVHLAINTLFHETVGASADAVRQKPVTVSLMGMLVLVLSVPAIVILAVTIVGLAVIPFLLCAMLVAGIVGKAGVARAMGRSLFRESQPDTRLKAFRSFMLGSILIGLAYMVPVLGLVTWLLTGLLAIGAVSVALGRKLRRERPQAERAVVAVTAGPVPPSMNAAASVAPSTGEPFAAPTTAPVPPPPSLRPADLAAYPRATFLDRVVAFALDCALVGIAFGVFDARHDGWFPFMLFLYHLVFWAWRGTTIGGIVVGLRVVRTDGTDMRPADAIVRALSSVFSLVALGIGCFWMLYDPGRQMWHDKIAGTVVAKVPRELVLP